MRKATLARIDSDDSGTFGILTTDTGFECFTGELPWRDNASDKSCIPPGIYTCTWRSSSRHGMCYHVENVPGRAGVEIHSANFMGDKEKGFQCQLLGCISPGMKIGTLDGQKAILASKEALAALEADLGQETFELTIS